MRTAVQGYTRTERNRTRKKHDVTGPPCCDRLSESSSRCDLHGPPACPWVQAAVSSPGADVRGKHRPRLRCVQSWHGDTVRHCTHCTTGMDGRCRAWPGVAPKLLNVASEVPSVACKAYCMAQTSEMSQVCQLHYWQHSICCIHGRHTCNQSVGPAAPCCFCCCCCCVHGVLTRSALGMQPLKKPTRPSSACIRRKQSTTPLYCEDTNAKTSTHSD